MSDNSHLYDPEKMAALFDGVVDELPKIDLTQSQSNHLNSVAALVEEKRKQAENSSREFLYEEEEDEDEDDPYSFPLVPTKSTEEELDLSESILFNRERVYDSDLSSDTSFHNIPVSVETDGYILLRGSYTKVFKEFIKNNDIIKDGWLPLCIELNGEILGIRRISPEPKVLHALQKILVGFEIKMFDGQTLSDLNIYHFLEKVQFSLGR